MKVDFTKRELDTVIEALRIYRAVVGATKITAANNDKLFREHKRSLVLLQRLELGK